MIKLQVVGITLSQVFDKLAYLRDQGYKQGVDFDFAYHPSYWDNFTGDDIKLHTDFFFYDECIATWFMLASNFREVNVFNVR